MSIRAKATRSSYATDEERRAARLESQRKYNSKRPKKVKDLRFSSSQDNYESTTGGELSLSSDLNFRLENLQLNSTEESQTLLFHTPDSEILEESPDNIQ